MSAPVETATREGGSFGCLLPILVFLLFPIMIPVVGAVGATMGTPSTSAITKPGQRPPPSNAQFVWPITDGAITDVFGWRISPTPPYTGESHTGIDIAAPTGTPVRAAAAGRVIHTDWYGGYGNLLKIAHNGPGGPFETWYGHLSGYAVTEGQTVAPGQVVAYVGSTGRSTGPHLHFEYRVDGSPFDPQRLFR